MVVGIIKEGSGNCVILNSGVILRVMGADLFEVCGIVLVWEIVFGWFVIIRGVC